jgi:hypothetical protein
MPAVSPIRLSFISRLHALWGRSGDGTECLRIGRHAVERWAASSRGQGWTLGAKVPLPEDALTRPAHLVAAITSLYPSPPAASISVVLESAWLPVVLAETGGTLVSDAQAQALVRHRLQRRYDTASDPVAAWDVRVDFLAGDAHALGYGLSPQVHQALTAAAEALGLTWRAITPAWVWGWAWAWQRFKPADLFPDQIGWWGWQEQDRMLLAQVSVHGSKAQLTSLHPGLAWSDDAQVLHRTVQAEAIRLGLPETPKAIRVAMWTPAPADAPALNLKWLSVGVEPTKSAALHRAVSVTPRL